jgi:uncharacterized membrane protein YfcA
MLDLDGGVSAVVLLLAVIAVSGAIAGFLAGLLGVGGGIVVVPALFWVLTHAGIDASIRMQVAVATSLATIIPTSIISARAHRKRGSLDEALLKRWFVPAILGAILGSAFASSVDGRLLAGIFGGVGLIVAIQMVAFPGGVALRKELPGPMGQRVMALLIGGLSSIMGIGGGTLAVPTLSLFSFPIRMAVGTAAGMGLFIAIPATLGFIAGGWHVADLPPFSIGYVSLPAGLAILAAQLPCVGYGAKVAHAISQPALRRAFGVVLAIVGLRMLSTLF